MEDPNDPGRASIHIYRLHCKKKKRKKKNVCSRVDFQSVACSEKVHFVLIAKVGGRVVENNKVFLGCFCLFIFCHCTVGFAFESEAI